MEADKTTTKRVSKGKSIEQYCLYLLGRREYSRSELYRKALKKFKNSCEYVEGESLESAVESVLDGLSEKGWLSDTRFCECYLRSQSEKGYGFKRIAYELEQKGVKASVVSSVEETLGIDWQANLERQMHRKYPFTKIPGAKSLDPKEKAVIVRFFQYRGHDLHDILSLLN
ncbi:MAG: regulatory protein RecX [Pseudomonadales bacterium]|nr:regulatory protein RecX [Pseudomonadales bacterium]